MQTKNSKYILTIATTAWNNSTEQVIDNKTKFKQLSFANPNLLIAREKALKEAKSLVDYFEDEDEDRELPTLKWTESFSGKAPTKWMWYQVKVEFENNAKRYCIYDTGDISFEIDDVLDNLKNEFEIITKSGINIVNLKQVIKYYDYKDKKNKQTSILKNGMNWSDTKINFIDGLEFGSLDNKKEITQNKSNKSFVNKKIKTNISFKAMYKIKFSINNNEHEITLKSTTQTISDALENDLDALIKKWTLKK